MFTRIKLMTFANRSAVAVVAMLFGFCATSSYANAKCFPGTASMSVYGIEEGEEPDESDVKKVKIKSMQAAWKVFSEQLEASWLQAYMRNKNKILSELNFYVTEKFTFEYDEGEQKIVGKNCISVDMKRLKASLKIEEKPAAIASGEGSLFVTLFVARQALSEKTFAAVRKRSSSATAGVSTAASSKSKSKTAAKEQAMASGGKAISMTKQKSKSKSKSASSATVSTSSQSGGSTLRRSNETLYKIISAKAANGALSQPLIEAGYEAADYDDVSSECEGVPRDEIAETFVTKEEMGRKQRRSAMRASRECEATYFAVGTMTADVARTHRSGRKMVTVRVQGTVYNITKRIARRVVDIPPAQYRGIGSNEDAARTNALTLAGKKAGQVITKAMQAKGLR